MSRRGYKHVNKRKLKTPEELEQAFLRRFWSYIDKAGPDECWLWNISCTAAGYGQIWRVDNMVYAHRVSYELTNGPIPDGLHVLHSCDNPPCCNPGHLHLGTHQDNMREMHERGRQGVRTPTPSPTRKLTVEQARTARRLSATVSTAELARRYNVAHYAMWLLLNGHSYKEAM